jgi:hypothetical protein
MVVPSRSGLQVQMAFEGMLTKADQAMQPDKLAPSRRPGAFAESFSRGGDHDRVAVAFDTVISSRGLGMVSAGQSF